MRSRRAVGWLVRRLLLSWPGWEAEMLELAIAAILLLALWWYAYELVTG